MMGSIHYLAGAIKKFTKSFVLSKKNQRDKPALLVAAMLDTKTANTITTECQKM